MNPGLLEKSLRESWQPTAVCALALFALECLLAYILPTFAEQTLGWLEVPFLQRFVQALIGAQVDSLGPHVVHAFAWVHPTVLVVFWTHEIILTTATPAGEIDRGTIDVLLGLPVSRFQVYAAHTVVWLAGGAVLVGGAAAGNLLGTRLSGAEVEESARLLRVLLNLFLLYGAYGAISLLISALSNRRGRVVSAVLALVFLSFVVNVVAQFWSPAKAVQFLSLLNYYQPLFIFRGDELPWSHLAVLAGVGATAWTLGAWIFLARDIRTV